MLETLLEFWPACVAFISVIIITLPLCKLALAAGFVDEPGGRKDHALPIPPIGGLIIFPIFIAVSIISGFDIYTYWPLYLALTMVLVTGAIDDRLTVPPWIKFAVHIGASAVIVIFGEARLYDLGDLFGLGLVELGLLSIPFSILCVALLINAMNLIDGLDGLSGGIALMSLLWLCIASSQGAAMQELSVVMSVIAGFLFFNMRSPFNKRARLFMGDAGSMGLGIIMSWYCIGLAQGLDKIIEPVSVAWIIVLPIMDAWGQFVRRVAQGKHPFDADRGHFHHHFIDAGFSPGYATLLIVAYHFILGGIGYLGFALGLPPALLSVFWAALFVTHIGLTMRPHKIVSALRFFHAHAVVDNKG